MSTPVVLITGALSGIGKAAALAFAAEGARLVLAGRRDNEGQALARALGETGVEVTYIRTDVRHDDEVRRLVERAVERFGRIDVAVNSAGAEGTPGPLTDQTAETYAAVFDTNVLGLMLCMKYELQVMQAQKSGCIVNISSSMGHKAAANMAVYTASKHALEGMTKAAALEAAPFGVRVNAVAPGPVETEMLKRLTPTSEKVEAMVAGVPLKRVGQVDEIARAILFVASEKSAFITGNVLWVDGGKSAG
jgi:NAD(P)-dependent dehydrogenase (short-subunit alcohol dehydrogenase family)